MNLCLPTEHGGPWKGRIGSGDLEREPMRASISAWYAQYVLALEYRCFRGLMRLNDLAEMRVQEHGKRDNELVVTVGPKPVGMLIR